MYSIILNSEENFYIEKTRFFEGIEKILENDLRLLFVILDIVYER